MERKVNDGAAYAQVVDAFKKSREGSTVADIVARTALPIEKVKELVPMAADEYGARLRVTESGEILYSFPDGFKSRYRGFRATAKRFLAALSKGAVSVGKALFKVWIVTMLVGYFVLFMAIALVALAASVAISASGSSSNDDRSSSRRGGGLGGLYLASRIFDLVIRIWFYSELAKSMDGYSYGRRSYAAKPKRRPLYQAVFSFVFGDGDPNADWETRERKAVIAYIQANRGVIALPEFMALTGATSEDAERRITSYLVEFGGSPEATEDGTVVYRFDDLLRRADRTDRSFAGLSAPIKRLKTFSSNPRKMNGMFIALNGANLAFGTYFLACALTVGPIVSQAQISGGTYLYAIALALFSPLGNPVTFATVVLGLIPLAFAALFYLIPALRSLREKAENERIKNENLRKDAYRRVWDSPMKAAPQDFDPAAVECRPQDMESARERVLKEIGVYTVPDVSITGDGQTIYSFGELKREKEALERYRGTVKLEDTELGATVFDSHS
jgi:hypothetical protein